MLPVGFSPLIEIIKYNLRANPGAKLTFERLENGMFNHLALKSQNKTVLQQLDLESLTELKKKYLAEIKTLKLPPRQQFAFNKAIQGAFQRFNLFLSFRKILFSSLPLKFPADELTSLRREYLRHKKVKSEREFEEIVKEWRKVDKQEEKIIRELDEAQQKKLQEELQPPHHSHGYRNVGKAAAMALALSLASLNDPKIVADNLTGNLLALNNILRPALKLQNVDLKLNPEHTDSLNHSIFTCEKMMRNPNPDPNNQTEINNQFNLVLGNLQQQYQAMQATIPPNNIAAQQLLQQWGAQAGQSLTQWVATGNVQPYDARFKANLGKEWNALGAKPNNREPNDITSQQQQNVNQAQNNLANVNVSIAALNSNPNKMDTVMDPHQVQAGNQGERRGPLAWPPKPNPH